MLLLWQPKH